MAVAAGRWLGLPTLLSFGGGELVWLPQINYGGQGTGWQRWKLRQILRFATDVTVGSHYLSDLLPSWRQPVHWTLFGVDASLFTNPSARPPGPPWRLLHVASLNRVKDPFTLLRALQQVVAVETLETLDQQITQEVVDAVAYARSSPDPDTAILFADGWVESEGVTG